MMPLQSGPLGYNYDEVGVIELFNHVTQCLTCILTELWREWNDASSWDSWE